MLLWDNPVWSRGWSFPPVEVLIDAYDALNRVPAALWKDDGPLVKALPSLLQKRAVLAATWWNETKSPKSDVFFVVRKGWGILPFNWFRLVQKAFMQRYMFLTELTYRHDLSWWWMTWIENDTQLKPRKSTKDITIFFTKKKHWCVYLQLQIGYTICFSSRQSYCPGQCASRFSNLFDAPIFSRSFGRHRS